MSHEFAVRAFVACAFIGALMLVVTALAFVGVVAGVLWRLTPRLTFGRPKNTLELVVSQPYAGARPFRRLRVDRQFALNTRGKASWWFGLITWHEVEP